MPLGDLGGVASVLIITCQATVNIDKGDPVALIENYLVTNKEGELFGMALKEAREGDTLPVLIKGILSFPKSKIAPNPGKVPRWSIRDGKLVPLLTGEALKILFDNNTRMDVLL